MLSLFVALVLASPAPVATDRPDVTNGTLTVPPGAWQLEVGTDVEASRLRVEQPPVALETALRIGVHQAAELRLLEGDVLEWATAATDPAGTRVRGDGRRALRRSIDNAPLLEFGGKVRLTELNVRRWVPSLGMQPVLALRPPGRAYRGVPVFGLAFIVSQPFGRIVVLDSNAAMRIDGNAKARRVVSGYVTGSLGVQVHPKILVYGELVGVLETQRAESLLADAGAIFTIAPRVAFDVAARAT
ncbi:MAG TPA: hypothetical protein VFG69_06680, partial [Nannocystaceae bacterium]|nr:hypothetical protein [Nannocystaceae bacterium]